MKPFTLVSFSKNAYRPTDSDDDESVDELENSHDTGDVDVEFLPSVYCKDSVVAVQPNVESKSYHFLFHVVSDGPYCLSENITCLGHLYQEGTKVLQGYYYEYVKSNRKGSIFMKSKSNYDILIPIGCVIYVGIDLLEEDSTLILHTRDHEDIMCSIAAQ